MYLRHFALTGLPFETPAHTDELFESNSRREAEARLQHLIELRGIGLLTERAHEVSGTSKRGRLGQNHRVPPRHLHAPSRPVPHLLRLAHHRQRARHVQVDRLGDGAAHRTLARHRLPRHPHRIAVLLSAEGG